MNLDEFIPLSNPFLFKKAFSNLDNRDALIHFLKSVAKIGEELLRNNLEVKHENILDKTRLDKNLSEDLIIKCDGHIINLEFYQEFDEISLIKSISNITKMVYSELEQGKTYNEMDNIIQINIIKKDKTGIMKDFVNEFHLQNIKTNEKLLPSKVLIKYYNLDKIEEEKL